MKKILKPPLDQSKTGELWLGNIASAKNIELLQHNGITHVLSAINVAEIAEIIDVYQNIGISHMKINIEDQIDTKITDYLNPAIDFIEKILET